MPASLLCLPLISSPLRLQCATVNGQVQSNPPNNVAQLATDFGYWTRATQQQTLRLDSVTVRNVDLLVENMGRVNFGDPSNFEYQKGLQEGNIVIDGQLMTQIETMALEFKSDWVKRLVVWYLVNNSTNLIQIDRIACIVWLDGRQSRGRWLARCLFSLHLKWTTRRILGSICVVGIRESYFWMASTLGGILKLDLHTRFMCQHHYLKSGQIRYK